MLRLFDFTNWYTIELIKDVFMDDEDLPIMQKIAKPVKAIWESIIDVLGAPFTSRNPFEGLWYMIKMIILDALLIVAFVIGLICSILLDIPKILVVWLVLICVLYLISEGLYWIGNAL